MVVKCGCVVLTCSMPTLNFYSYPEVPTFVTIFMLLNVGQSSKKKKKKLNLRTSYFKFSALCYAPFKELYFTENPIKIGQVILKLWPIEWLSKQ